MEIFAPAATIKRRALDGLLTIGVGFVGMVASFRIRSEPFSVGVGIAGGLLVGFLGRRLWPVTAEAPARREWVRLLSDLIIPCGVVLGAAVLFAISKADLAGTYCASFAGGLVVSAVLDMRAIGKRASE